MLEPHRSDRSLEGLVKTRDLISVPRRQNSESGQATVEFALILLPLLLLVAGIIQFGIALNFWLDEQRIANQGARWAVVNCGPQAAVVCNPSLEAYLEAQPLSQGNNADVTICYEAMNGVSGGNPAVAVGDPVTVKLALPFTFVPIVNIGTLDLRASATMRMEARPTQGGLNGFGLCP